MQFDDTLLLIEPEAAKRYEASQSKADEPTGGEAEPPHPTPSPSGSDRAAAPQAKVRSFHGMAEIPPATAKIRLVQLADEIISVLSSDPNAVVKVTVEIGRVSRWSSRACEAGGIRERPEPWLEECRLGMTRPR